MLANKIRIGDNWTESFISVTGKNINGKFVVDNKRKLSNEVFFPSELPKIITVLNDCLRDVSIEEVEVTSGINMGSELSFPTLNAIACACSIELSCISPDTVTRCYGDDVIGKGPREIEIPLNRRHLYPDTKYNPNDCLAFIREQFGMKKKESASGTQDDRLTVFCEKFFSNDGEEHFGVKPHSFLKLVKAKYPTSCFLTTTPELCDFKQLYEETYSRFPRFITLNSLEVLGESTMRSTTATRHYIMQLMLSVEAKGSVVPPVNVKQLTKRAEAYLFCICPPSRGHPEQKAHSIPSSTDITANQFRALSDVIEELEHNSKEESLFGEE
jgi:hypothetical protein